MQPGKIMAGHQGKNTLYVFFGLIATGKSTLAEAWAESLHLPYYNSDRVRKQLAGLNEETSRPEEFNQGIYSKKFSRQTYTALLERAALHLQQGVSVVLDASYQAKEERCSSFSSADNDRWRVRSITRSSVLLISPMTFAPVLPSACKPFWSFI